MRHAVLFTGVMALLLAGSCTGSKSFSKKGAKLDASGMYVEAADMYLQSAVRNPNNIDAKIGLKKTGQQLLNDKLGGFFKAFNIGIDKEAAVNAYLDAKDYQAKVQRAGVALDIPANYADDFSTVKGQYLVQLYTEGHDLLDQKNYAAAQVAFTKIGRLEPGYKDAGSLQELAYLEPLYISGKSAYAAGNYRQAYAILDSVVAKAPAYKDVATIRQQCVEKGRTTLAVLPFTSASKWIMNRTSAAATLQAYVTSALTLLNDPFLAVVDRDNIQKILDEQRLGLSGVVDESSAVSAGRLLGAQAVIIGTVISYTETPGNLRTSTKDGYEGYDVKQLDKSTNQYVNITKYKPVKYTEYYQENNATISFSYKLVSLQTGQVLLSKVLDKQATDHAYYADYDGNVNALYPVLNGNINNTVAAHRDLVGLVQGSRLVKSVGTLGTEALQATSAAMAGDVERALASQFP